MTKIYVYSCLLSALSVVEMKPLNIDGRVGERLTFTCSDWNNWISVKYNEKYFCRNPCTEDKHIIIKAAFEKTEHTNRIQLTNGEEGLFVTFTELQKSDSNTYYCGVTRMGSDPLIRVNLKVLDAKSSSPKTTPKTVTVGSTVSFDVTNNFTVSSSSSEMIADMSTSYMTLNTTPTASATQEAGSIPYLMIGVIIIITILMVLLKLMSQMMRKQLKVVSNAIPPQDDAQEDAEYDEIRPQDETDPDCLYVNYSKHQDTESAAKSGYSNSKDVSIYLASRFEVSSRGVYAESRVTDPQCDLVYSLAQLPKEQTELTDGQSEPSQSENEHDSLYSLAQLPQATLRRLV